MEGALIIKLIGTVHSTLRRLEDCPLLCFTVKFMVFIFP
jgi:hypothetical protein